MAVGQSPSREEMQGLILQTLSKGCLTKGSLEGVVYGKIAKRRRRRFNAIFKDAFGVLKSQGKIVQDGSSVMTKDFAEKRKKG